MKLLKKIDDELLKILLIAFIFFIPLFPKFPFKAITYTYISIRLDDFMAALIAIVFIIQLLRKKISFRALPYKKIIGLFWVVIFLSLLSGVYVTKTLHYFFVGLLHAARRIEYMMLFFIAFSVIKSSTDFKKLIIAFLTSTFLINIYGIGQRFFEFPAVSTMNPEFAKGRILFLTPEARLSSTFAGHYDLAAFLIFIMPLLWGFLLYAKKLQVSQKMKAFILIAAVFPIALSSSILANISATTVNHVPIAGTFFSPINQLVIGTTIFFTTLYLVLFNKINKVLIFATIALSMLSLVFTVSRTSSIAYAISTLPFLLFVRKFRYFFIAVILSVGLIYADADLVQRWAKTIQIRQVIVNEKTGEEVVVQRINKNDLPAGNAFIKTRNTLPLTQEAELTKSDLLARATLSGNLKTATEGGIITADDYQVISAIAADTSISTRLQVSWPRAIAAFKRNPLLGTGPSSITESSDGDYFRWIGETGAAGFILFVGIILMIVKNIFSERHKLSKEGRFLVTALVFGVFGLLVNAILIDVFEASKMAYLFWTMLGIFAGMTSLNADKIENI